MNFTLDVLLFIGSIFLAVGAGAGFTTLLLSLLDYFEDRARNNVK
jgi:hypothetical protein